MCRVYNEIGCLTQIKSHLNYHGLNEYKSLNTLIDFQKSYAFERQKIYSKHRALVEEEKSSLSLEIPELDLALTTAKEEAEQKLLEEIEKVKLRLEELDSASLNFVRRLTSNIKKIHLRVNIKSLERKFQSKINQAVSYLVEQKSQKNQRYNYILSSFEDAITQSSLSQIQEHDRKKNVIDLINGEIYGAFGERKVAEKLKELSDDYVLINDFSCRFNPAIYNRRENDYIKSIQIDHLLITPSGVFLIETKNWNERSVYNPNYRSPVLQVKRTNFALFRLLNIDTKSIKYLFVKHPWDGNQIPIRNLIVFTNYKPEEKFKHVKILTPNELIDHIRYFKASFSDVEVDAIAGHLLALNVK